MNNSSLSKERIVSVLENEGFVPLARKVFKKTVYRKRSFLFTQHDLHSPLKKYKVSNRWRVDVFTPQDIPKCRAHFGQYIPDYIDLFNDGLKSYAAYETETNNVVGIIWYADSDFYDKHYLRCKFSVEPHQVLQVAAEVSLPYRNTTISVDIMRFAWAYWEEQGKDEVFCYTDVSNAPSLRVQFHLHWEEMGRLIHIHRLFGYQWQKMESYSGERFTHFKKKPRRKTPV